MQPFSSEHIEILKEKFHTLANSFLSDDHVSNNHIELKREHTLRVCDEIKRLAMNLGLKDTEVKLAYVIALFHDMGRFEQFSKYRTFDDSRSVDHAALSVETLRSDGFLDHMHEDHQKLIINAILNHNKPFPDFSENNEITLFSKLLRDADKLDIWNVITTDELRKVIEKGNLEIFYEIPDTINRRFVHGKIVMLDMITSDNDMRLLRISWIFDINFACTFDEIKKRKVLNKIFDLIPDSDRKSRIKEIVDGYIEEKTGEGRQATVKIAEAIL